MSRFISRWDAECENWSYVQDSMKKNSPKRMKPSLIIHLTYEHHGRSCHWFFLESLIEKGHGFVFGASLRIFLGFFVWDLKACTVVGQSLVSDLASEGIMQDIESLYTFKELFNINNCCTFCALLVYIQKLKHFCERGKCYEQTFRCYQKVERW